MIVYNSKFTCATASVVVVVDDDDDDNDDDDDEDFFFGATGEPFAEAPADPAPSDDFTLTNADLGAEEGSPAGEDAALAPADADADTDTAPPAPIDVSRSDAMCAADAPLACAALGGLDLFFAELGFAGTTGSAAADESSSSSASSPSGASPSLGK